MNNLQLWNATNPHYAFAELVVQYQEYTTDPYNGPTFSKIYFQMNGTTALRAFPCIVS